LLEVKFSAGEYCEVWNALHVVSRSKLRELFRVDFEHHSASCQVSRDFRDMRRCHAAWPAPGSPKVDKDRDFAVANDLVEVLGADLKGLGNRRKWRFACSASSRVGQVFRRNSIRLSAGWAFSDEGHCEVLHFFAASAVLRRQGDRDNRD
jgi:hypothetical protein